LFRSDFSSISLNFHYISGIPEPKRGRPKAKPKAKAESVGDRVRNMTFVGAAASVPDRGKTRRPKYQRDVEKNHISEHNENLTTDERSFVEALSAEAGFPFFPPETTGPFGHKNSPESSPFHHEHEKRDWERFHDEGQRDGAKLLEQKEIDAAWQPEVFAAFEQCQLHIGSGPVLDDAWFSCGFVEEVVALPAITLKSALDPASRVRILVHDLWRSVVNYFAPSLLDEMILSRPLARADLSARLVACRPR
jgi:hypothetical protein